MNNYNDFKILATKKKGGSNDNKTSYILEKDGELYIGSRYYVRSISSLDDDIDYYREPIKLNKSESKVVRLLVDFL